jgi:hypothetical protein
LTTKAPIHVVLRRIRPLAPVHKVAHLRGLIASELKRSIRRHELEEALKEILNRQLRKENRNAA